MKIVSREELTPEMVTELRKTVFVYPTDTIYGIGCDATNEELVDRIRKLKMRSDNPFSVVVPDISLVHTHCRVSDDALLWLKKLPGPYTLVLPVNESFVAPNVAPGNQSIGVRMLSSWFQDVVAMLGVPIVTTSVNVTGDPHMKSLDEMDADVARGVDIAIDDGVLSGSPSTVVLLTGNQPRIISR